MGERAITRILAIFACIGFVWMGIAFAAFALTTALTPSFSLAGAAAVTAALLLIIPVVAMLLVGRKGRAKDGLGTADSILSVIARVARERPVLAMLGAAALGAAEVFLSKRKSKK